MDLEITSRLVTAISILWIPFKRRGGAHGVGLGILRGVCLDGVFGLGLRFSLLTSSGFR
jgi:hypothetical protein